MDNLKKLGIAALAATALTAFVATGSASATTLEVEGKAKNEALGYTLSLETGQSTTFTNTLNEPLMTCNESELNGTTVANAGGTYTGPTVEGSVIRLIFGKCTNLTKVLKNGVLVFTWTKNTEGTLTWVGGELTINTALFGDVVCKPATGGTVIGTITGVALGKAALDVNTVLNCGFTAPSVRWQGKYVFTSPPGLGIIN
jgi:hypothetical protein